ncbi:hypothetical protein GPECTOR_10g782 [Gonium pectorale]|uniref:Uncharacterized protein n=1 Tax=Gonium pectorale TaxID=33097 RepID=A0A150GQU0_GONPE|nr:hypothetical protein GPECTOR_10g782 [Gonium pectorale]|eukprot:KXZ52153.1 hypothetical protein GPECTOR_10g782 [Gonium pectorale]
MVEAAGHVGAAAELASPGPQQLPASSITLLHGCLTPSVGLPPLQRGELRRCGTTFHPEPAERGHQGGVPPEVVCYGVARLLGLTSALAQPARVSPLPEGPVAHPCLQPHPEGLCSAQRLPAGEALAVVGGYVLPALTHGLAFVARGHEALPPAARGQLRRLSAPVGEDEAAEGLLWPALARLWRLPFPSVTTPGSGGLELHQLGYGSLAALVADPRVWGQPSASAARPAASGGDEEEEASALNTNCTVSLDAGLVVQGAVMHDNVIGS